MILRVSLWCELARSVVKAEVETVNERVGFPYVDGKVQVCLRMRKQGCIDHASPNCLLHKQIQDKEVIDAFLQRRSREE